MPWPRAMGSCRDPNGVRGEGPHGSRRAGDRNRSTPHLEGPRRPLRQNRGRSEKRAIISNRLERWRPITTRSFSSEESESEEYAESMSQETCPPTIQRRPRNIDLGHRDINPGHRDRNHSLYEIGGSARRL